MRRSFSFGVRLTALLVALAHAACEQPPAAEQRDEPSPAVVASSHSPEEQARLPESWKPFPSTYERVPYVGSEDSARCPRHADNGGRAWEFLCSQLQHPTTKEGPQFTAHFDRHPRLDVGSNAELDLNATLSSTIVHLRWHGRAAQSYRLAVPAAGASDALDFTLDPDGLRFGSTTIPWKGKRPTLHAGRVDLSLTGKVYFVNSKKVSFRTPTLTYDVADASQTRLSVGDLLKRAAHEMESALQETGALLERGHEPSFDGENEQGLRRVAYPGPRLDEDSSVHFIGFFSENGHLVRMRRSETFGCVAENSLLTTPDSQKPIEQVQVGDLVLGYDLLAKSPRWVTVEAVREREAKQLIIVNDTLRTTADHPILGNRSKLAAGALVRGMHLLGATGDEIEVASLERKDVPPTRVFDLEVSPPHTFFADGALVHNKTLARHRYSLAAAQNGCDPNDPFCAP